MGDQIGIVSIVVVCVIVLLVGAMRKRLEWLLNLLMRSILGIVAIYFINNTLAAQGISLGIGINAVTVLTCGILGIPGLMVVYALGIYRLL